MFSKACYKKLLSGLLLVLTLGFAGTALAELPAWRQLQPQLKATGSGSMTFFGLRIYDATLWTQGERWKADEAHALELVYARSISREQLVKSSVEEMQRVGISRQQAEAWAAPMRRVFVDVSAGDRLVGVFLPARGALFYSGKGLIGEIDDPEFARAFAAIWLDQRTREPALRKRLLGLPS